MLAPPATTNANNKTDMKRLFMACPFRCTAEISAGLLHQVPMLKHSFSRAEECFRRDHRPRTSGEESATAARNRRISSASMRFWSPESDLINDLM
jgi:hypothetical protein